MKTKHLAIGGGGKKSSSQSLFNFRARVRAKSLTQRLLHLSVLCALSCTVLVGCADEDIPQPSQQPLMTRADSIAAGLLPVVPTADGAWDGETVYDFDGNPVEQLGVSGSDTDAEKDADGHTWGE